MTPTRIPSRPFLSQTHASASERLVDAREVSTACTARAARLHGSISGRYSARPEGIG